MLTVEELIDVVKMELSISCSLPNQLPDTEIRRIIEYKAAPWFYNEYSYAKQKMYYYLQREGFMVDPGTKYSFINVPCEITNVVWVKRVSQRSFFNVAVQSPQLDSVILGSSNNQVLNSYVSTIGDVGVYKSILGSFGDMLDQFNVQTVKRSFSALNHRLNILDKVDTDFVLEAYAKIPLEALAEDPLFIKYVTGFSKIQLGNLLTRYDYNLPGGVKINGQSLIEQGKEEVKEVEDTIKGMSNSSFFYMVKR